MESTIHREQKKVRIFSLRGCHLVAMFARTAVAKEFRKWVLDVLDKEAQPQPAKAQTDRQSTAAQLTPLRQKVEQLIATGVGNIYGDIWKLVHNRFEVKTINQLRPEQIGEAVQYLDAIEGEYIAKIASQNLPNISTLKATQNLTLANSKTRYLPQPSCLMIATERLSSNYSMS